MERGGAGFWPWIFRPEALQAPDAPVSRDTDREGAGFGHWLLEPERLAETEPDESSKPRATFLEELIKPEILEELPESDPAEAGSFVQFLFSSEHLDETGSPHNQEPRPGFLRWLLSSESVEEGLTQEEGTAPDTGERDQQ